MEHIITILMLVVVNRHPSPVDFFQVRVVLAMQQDTTTTIQTITVPLS
jgi:hypothetical protein